MDRFFIDRALDLRPGTEVHLSGAEAHHLAHVKRLGRGHRVRLFDGKGREAWAEVASVGKGSDVTLIVSGGTGEEPRRPPGERPPLSITLGVAPPKGKRLAILLEKATELGAAAFFPLVTSRTAVDLTSRSEARDAKWRRTTIEAAKQSGASMLPELLPTLSFAEALERFGRSSAPDARAGDGVLRLLPHLASQARPLREVVAAFPGRPAGAIVLIGPEGGFTEPEAEAAARSGFELVRLGGNVLRVETAAIAALAALAYAFG